METNPYTNDFGSSSVPPIARMLDLELCDYDSKIWRDDFLALGGRLRDLYGAIAIDEENSAYLVAMRGIEVSVTCSDEEPRAETVRITCPIGSLAEADTNVWKFALRENARLELARLSFDRGMLWADYELPWRVAIGPPLQAGVSAVGKVAVSLGRELATAA